MKTLHVSIIKFYQTLLFVCCLSAPTTTALAGEFTVDFSPSLKYEGITMNLQGQGLKRFLFFKAFEAGLYLEKGLGPDQALMDVPKSLEVEYFVKIPGHKLSSFTINNMKATLTPSDYQNLQKRIDLMKEYFVDLKSGDRFALTYIPGQGTKFNHNGRLIGTIKGEDFSQALFSVWFGSNSFDNDLKSQILGLRKKVMNDHFS